MRCSSSPPPGAAWKGDGPGPKRGSFASGGLLRPRGGGPLRRVRECNVGRYRAADPDARPGGLRALRFIVSEAGIENHQSFHVERKTQEEAEHTAQEKVFHPRVLPREAGRARQEAEPSLKHRAGVSSQKPVRRPGAHPLEFIARPLGMGCGCVLAERIGVASLRLGTGVRRREARR